LSDALLKVVVFLLVIGAYINAYKLMQIRYSHRDVETIKTEYTILIDEVRELKKTNVDLIKHYRFLNSKYNELNGAYEYLDEKFELNKEQYQ